MVKTLKSRRHFTSFLTLGATVTLVHGTASAVDRVWTNASLVKNRWDQTANWDTQVPSASEVAKFNSGTGAFLVFTGSIGFSASAGTIEIATIRDQNNGTGTLTSTGYYALDSSNTAGVVSTISFSSGGSGTGFRLNMASFVGTNYQSKSFYVGARAGNTTGVQSGTLHTSISDAMNVRVAQQQRLNYYSTVEGSGSITLDSVVRTDYAAASDLGELTLGFGHGPTGSVNAKSFNTFSGGVFVYSGILNLAEDSQYDLSGAMTSSAAGLGSITFAPAVGTFTSNAKLTGFDDRVLGAGSLSNPLPPNSTRTLGNTVNFNADVDIAGHYLGTAEAAVWNMDFRGAMNFGNGTMRTLNVYPGTSSFQATMSGPVTLGSGTNGFTLAKGGLGTLLFNDATINTTSGGGTIVVASGTLNYSVPTGNTRTFDGVFESDGSLLTGTLQKSGAGTVQADRVRVNRVAVTGGTLTIAADGTAAGLSQIGILSITGARMDVNDNDLIVSAGTYGGVTSLIASARAGTWTGNGLTSSAARTRTNLNTTLGVLVGTEFAAIHGSLATFNGVLPAGADLLVKYTYYGDADFNGVVNFDDYSRTDAGFNNNRTGWVNGDYDHNGSVNFDDYSLIDNAFNTQVETINGGDGGGGNPRLIELGQMWHFQLEGYLEYFIQWNAARGVFYTVEDFYPTGNRPPSIGIPEPVGLPLLGLGLSCIAARRRKRRN